MPPFHSTLIHSLAQLGEAAKAVESIGLTATIVLILLSAFGVLGWGLFRYFTGRLDKKDEQLVTLSSTYTKSLVDMTNERRDDLDKFAKVLDANLAGHREVVASHKEIVASQKELVSNQKDLVQGQKEVTSALRGLANKVMGRKPH